MPSSDNSASSAPDLSVIVTIVSGGAHLEDCLLALKNQIEAAPWKIEVIVPYDERRIDVPNLISMFPDVVFYKMSMKVQGAPGLCHEHFDELRSNGLHISRGRIVALLEDHGVPELNWVKNIMKLHDQSYDAVGGVIDNDIDAPLNWATYFLDFGRYMPPVKPGPSHFLSDINISYKRGALEDVRDVWESGFHEPWMHEALRERGRVLYLSQDIVVNQHRYGLKLLHCIRERYIWGRYFSGKRVARASLASRVIYCGLSLTVPLIILAKQFRQVLGKRRRVVKFAQATPYILILVIAWSAGEFLGYVTGRSSNYCTPDTDH